MARLLVVSLLTGILWRAELEIRWGWASLDWIGPFHWAVPVAATLVLVWMGRELRELAPRKRQIVLGVTGALGLLAYFGGSVAMTWSYGRWMGLPPFSCMAFPVVVYAVLGAVYFTTVARLASPSPVGMGVGVACYLAAFPLAFLLLWFTNHRGGPDPIHAIKSGFVFPLITFALGLPIAMKKGAASRRLGDLAADAPNQNLAPLGSEDDAVFKVQDLIFAKYGEPDFQRRDFQGYANLPLAWRMPIMTNVLEGEIINGGLAQFLWNTVYHHQRILQDARSGYELVGASCHAAAVGRCIEICARFEQDCMIAVEASLQDKNSSHFIRWYADAESKMSFPEENFFESDSNVVALKGRWILAHVDQYQDLLN